jgi:hypothetical protein
MEKEATRAHNSPMSASGRQGVRFRPPVNERPALIRAKRAARRAKCARGAARQGAMAACIVETPVRPMPDGRQARRTVATAETMGCPRAKLPAHPAQKAHATVRAGGVPLSRQGTRRSAFGRGQATYLAADGAPFRGKPRFCGYHGARASQALRTCK